MSSAPSVPSSAVSHPTFAVIKARFAGKKFRATEYRGCSTLIVEPADLLEVLTFLKTDASCAYEMLSDIAGVDYLNYPAAQPGRFGVVYNLLSLSGDRRFFVKTYLNPSLPTDGIAADPSLVLPSVCGLWSGAEWMEREAFDMVGIRFDGHPDLRRILTWESYPAHPLRKDYPLRGRGERDMYKVLDRTSA